MADGAQHLDEPILGPTLRAAILGVLSLLVLVVGLHQAGRDAPTVDEGIDVSSGVSHLVHRDLRMNPEHPPLPKVVASLPSLLADPIVPKGEAWERGDWFDWSDDFISANAEAGRLDDVLRWQRAVVLLEVVAIAALLYLLTTRFFGPDGATLVAALWLTTPYVVGIGHFAMIDVPFVLVTLALLLVLARWSDDPTTPRAVAVGAVLAAALATRHTALVLALGVVAVMAHRQRADRRAAATAVGITTLVSVLGLWLIYRGLAPGGSSSSVEANLQALVSGQGEASAPARLVGALPLPLEWRAGFAYLDLTSVPRPSALLGQSWDGGRWWYFPMSALLKLPFTLVVAVVAGWAMVARRSAHRRSLLTFVAGPALLLWLFLVAQPLNLGLRLALPTVALALVGAGALVAPARRAWGTGGAPRALAVSAIAILGLVQLASFGVAAPHSLAWAPPPWRPEFRWMSDANLDAGQALYEVRAWAEERESPYVAVDTTRGMRVGGRSRPLSEVAPEEVRGWVAVGVTPLVQTRRDDTVWTGEGDPPPGFSLAWLRKYCPVATLGGGSILVYRFDEAPDPTPGPERPAAPCFGAARSTAS
jgi:4-amino-4-deoxy-L-arabinose transferase-like glycosyltransferase